MVEQLALGGGGAVTFGGTVTYGAQGTVIYSCQRKVTSSGRATS